ncbi:MAG: 50S ribosomal protein L25/general stress protein Ctc [Alphaproteobacteria bacterium]|nr:50S ribosomal protein L25/general stress protein Ctc [Alphaproteobacteria bacterium]MDE1984951.1 50S ribosomal protein L25/general stress protein Ctc [Alphaproteobacteria bacterium]MDE2162295.1 50S ribosomal protein L25/general stress protein Ctc [Alphaproteobacteria bacterium]MDE2265695.1 50S ribosomal protein L25/general stress protein Ctc [Alphaproteobacteria bacterium]MDE2498879.1 50S ribosomal protein L25/general stress protein Ctc [Alphaproteobacteria bacterium]
MRQIQELSAEVRGGTGKGPAYQARRNGKIPAIVYGGSAEPEPIAVDAQTLGRFVDRGSFLTTLFMLDTGGKKTRVIPRALQLDPVTDRPVHVDFMRLEEGATVRLAIPVRFVGRESSPGIKLGGVLNIVRHEVELICPADNIPDFIEGDLSGMDIRDSLHISAFKLPEGVRPTIDRDFTVASIVAPTHVIEEQRAAAAAAAAAASAPAAEEGAAPAEGAAAPGAAPAAGAAAPAAGAKAPEKK